MTKEPTQAELDTWRQAANADAKLLRTLRDVLDCACPEHAGQPLEALAALVRAAHGHRPAPPTAVTLRPGALA